MTHELPMLSQILKALEDIQAFDIKVIDVKKQTSITDYMIVVSGRSSRHVKAIGETVLEVMKKAAFPTMSVAGFESNDWVLIDFGDIVLHVMQTESRQYYNLEGLWLDTKS